ncbi:MULTISPECIES: GGGtGRT protein [Clostridium]|nr:MULTISPECIES: GGGtGRT protein [Clostridium]
MGSTVKSKSNVEMMGLIGMGNNPMVGASVAVAVEEAMNK